MLYCSSAWSLGPIWTPLICGLCAHDLISKHHACSSHAFASYFWIWAGSLSSLGTLDWLQIVCSYTLSLIPVWSLFSSALANSSAQRTMPASHFWQYSSSLSPCLTTWVCCFFGFLWFLFFCFFFGGDGTRTFQYNAENTFLHNFEVFWVHITNRSAGFYCFPAS